MGPGASPRRLARFEFLSWCDGAVISGFEGVIKPVPAIFYRLLDRYGLAPERTLFIDDREDNIDGARAVGLHGGPLRGLIQGVMGDRISN